MRTVLVGIVVASQLAGCATTSNNQTQIDPARGIAAAIGGAIVVPLILRLIASAGRDPKPTPVVTPESQKQATAKIMTAKAAASVGDCAMVVRLGYEVQRLDVRFYESVFLTDVSIAQCLPKPAPTGALVDPFATQVPDGSGAPSMSPSEAAPAPLHP